MIDGVAMPRMFRLSNISATLAALLVLAYLLFGVGEDKPVIRAQPIDSERRLMHMLSFDQMWRTIRDNHVDPNLHGLDWEAVRKELRPSVESARTDPEAREVFRRLMRKIRTSHYFYQVGSAADPNSPLRNPLFFIKDHGWHGVELAWRNEQAIVTRVWRNSPGERCGIRPGWVLLEADGVRMAERMQSARDWDWGPYRKPTWQTMTAQSMLQGKPGQELKAKFLDLAEQPVDKRLVLAGVPGRVVRSDLLAGQTLHIDSRVLNGNIGYFYFSWFADRELVQRDFSIALGVLGQPRGLIIDLRGNRGGKIAATMDLAGVFFSEPGSSLGTFVGRADSQQHMIVPGPIQYRGKLALLVDESTMSAGEVFTAGLQDLKRARVFGAQTSGWSLPANLMQLPNGDVFNYVVGDILRPSGTSLEGVGVTPDEIVELDRKKFLQSNDPVLDAAVRWISRP